LSEAEATCDRIVIINQGKIVADGSADILKKSVSQSNVIHMTLQHADFKTLENLCGKIEGLQQIERIEESDNHLQVRISSRASDDVRADIYRKIKDTDWILLEFHQETQNLETIFRQLTKEN
jgi:ABC-2 type transport system ATP-binding protein